jgi:hypothetical protein
MSHSNGSGGVKHGLGILTKDNHKEWCEQLRAGLEAQCYFAVRQSGPQSEKGLASIHLLLLSDDKLAENAQRAALQVQAKAEIFHRRGHALMITALGSENGHLHLKPSAKTGMQLYAAITALSKQRWVRS